MFMTRIARRWAMMSARAKDEQGMALAAVLTFMSAGVLLSAIVASSVVYALQFSTTTRAGVQSQAAAEAGIAAARAGLINGTCVASGNEYTSATAPIYEATIWIPAGTGWARGCPADISSQVRVISTGWAEAPGAAHSDSGDVTHIEAILSAASSPTSLIPSGPAIYAYTGAGFGGSGTLVSVDGSIPDVLLQQGNVNCNGNMSGVANFVVKTGNLSSTGSCTIGGNVWVSGNVEIQGGAVVGGNITGSSASISSTVGGNVWVDGALQVKGGSVGGTVRAGQVTITNGSITGQTWSSTGAAVMSGGSIEGYLNAAGLDVSNGTLSSGFGVWGALCVKNPGAVNIGAASIAKSLTTSGTCTSKSKDPWWSGWSKIQVKSTYTGPITEAPQKPASITVPQWVDFGSKAADYTAATWSGFTVVKMGTVCGAAEFYAALQTFGANPGVVDARTCTKGISFNGGDIQYSTDPNANHNGFTFQNDVAIIANKIDIQGSTSFVGSTGYHNLWLINPDTVANNTPDCNGESFSLGGNFTTPNLNVMMYSPCEIKLASGLNIRGQIFAAASDIAGNATISYIATGLPGYDLGTGLPTTTNYTEADRWVVSQRNITEVP
ncbi:bactofilin family protein [Pseudolysinimonas yzui]|uniref:Uncharacterized protein n=1 Tax=Pseudolysinimonas yzui TaxID=2708254 RepID=A0A8J3GS52_9MICO|nr:polymer-forming cytoskeletal protein [Pseudolysinimonas yzui]GHF20933.1 hypothetical protein GCM10011600_22470 [Pseudolysinimonas yzui]